MRIELYSVKGFTGSALRDKLQHALTEFQIESEVVEINSVEQFVLAGLPSVPAIRIGDRIFLHPHNSTIDETIGQVMEFILHGRSPSILVPIDFSAESLHALKYAGIIAEFLHLGLTLTHVHQPIYDPVSGGACDVLLQRENQIQLHELADDIRRNFRERGILIPVDVHLETGDPASNLIQLSASDHYKFIIMATKAKDTAFRRLFSTITSRVGRHSHKPVMIIPPQSPLAFPKRWMLGFDQAFLESKTLDQLFSYHDEQHVSMAFTHFGNAKKGLNEEMLQSFRQRLNDHPNGYADFTCEVLKPMKEPIDELLFQQVSKNKADLLVLFSQQRSFLESIQHSSVIRKAIQHPTVPVLIFPLQLA